MLATFLANTMKIGPVTPEITRVINAPFWIRPQKSAYLTEYPTNYWIDLHQRFSVGRRMYGNYRNYISFVVVQGELIGNQLILGDFCRRQNWLSSLFALLFWNEMEHRLADTRINSFTNCFTSSEKIVKIGPAVFELKWGRNWKLCCNSAEISLFSFIWHTGVLIGISKFYLSPLISNHFCTSCENFVRFARGDTTAPSGLFARLCYAFLVFNFIDIHVHCVEDSSMILTSHWSISLILVSQGVVKVQPRR